MGKKGKKGRLKRKPAPRFWPIHRKESVWIVRPSCGPHSLPKCLTLALIIRDFLGLAKTRKEAKKIISQGKIYVDGKVRRNDDFPVGLMDVISIPDLTKFYRVLPSHKGLFLDPITKEEANFKLSRIEGKNMVKSGASQFALHDGSNILVKLEESKNSPDVVYETFATLKLGLPEKVILEQLETKKGSFAIITGGKNIGKKGKIIEIEKTKQKKRKNALVVIETENGNRYQTILEYVFSIGKSKTLISSLEATELV